MMIIIHKAEQLSKNHKSVDSVVIEISKPLNTELTEYDINLIYQNDAKKILDGLRSALPFGTLIALYTKMGEKNK